MSPFVDNETEGYIPDRQREINTLAGVETAVIAQPASDESAAEESDSDVEPESDSEESAEVKQTNKGDADSSSDDSESEEPQPKKPKAAPKVDKKAKNDKLKKDLQKEQQELGKMLMTKRQRQAFQKAEQTQKTKLAATKKLVQKKALLSKKKL